MKLLMKIVKKIVFAFALLYSLNLILSSIGVIVPINLFTIFGTSLLGFPMIVITIIINRFIV